MRERNPQAFFTLSEQKLQTELKLTGRGVPRQGLDYASRWIATRRAVGRGARISEHAVAGLPKLRMVKQVISFRPELNAEGFRDLPHPSILYQSNVNLRQARTHDRIPASVTERTQSGQAVARRFEPLVRRPRLRLAACHNVRPRVAAARPSNRVCSDVRAERQARVLRNESADLPAFH